MRPADDGIQRGAQLVGEGGKKLIFQQAGVLRLGSSGALVFQQSFAFGIGPFAGGDLPRYGQLTSPSIRQRQGDGVRLHPAPGTPQSHDFILPA